MYTNLPQLAKVRQNAAAIEVTSDQATSRSKAGTNVRFDNKPHLHSLLGQETCRSQKQPHCAISASTE